MKNFILTVLLFVAVGSCYAQKNAESRDEKILKTVKIGNQEWMAENLNIKTGKSWCYKNDNAKCSQYGRLYDWNTALKACPAGWRLPTADDFSQLLEYARKIGSDRKVLTSTSGWTGNANGLDEFGFAALPGGNREYNGSYVREGDGVRFWSSTEDPENNRSAKALYFYYSDDNTDLSYFGKKNGFYVRCIKK